MLRRLNPILFLMCCSIPGCMAIDSLANWSDHHSCDSTEEHVSKRTFDMNDPVDWQEAYASAEQFLIVPQLVADTPLGSQVHIVDKSDKRFIGTLLNSGPDGVELMNCICREVVPAPDGQQQCKTSHVPFQSLKTSAMTRFVVISPPSADFAIPDQDMDTREVSIEEIVFKSGRRQRWGKPPDSAEWIDAAKEK